MLGVVNSNNLLLAFEIKLARFVLGVDIGDAHLGILVRSSNSNNTITLNGHGHHTKPAVVNVLSNEVDATGRTCNEVRFATIDLGELLNQVVVTNTGERNDISYFMQNKIYTRVHLKDYLPLLAKS